MADKEPNKDELLLELARLIARLAISLRIHKETACVTPMESHPLYAGEVRRFQTLLSQMETSNSSSPSDAQSRYEALREIQANAAALLQKFDAP
jgi:hypothetical protein